MLEESVTSSLFHLVSSIRSETVTNRTHTPFSITCPNRADNTFTSSTNSINYHRASVKECTSEIPLHIYIYIYIWMRFLLLIIRHDTHIRKKEGERNTSDEKQMRDTHWQHLLSWKKELIVIVIFFTSLTRAMCEMHNSDMRACSSEVYVKKKSYHKFSLICQWRFFSFFFFFFWFMQRWRVEVRLSWYIDMIPSFIRR